MCLVCVFGVRCVCETPPCALKTSPCMPAPRAHVSTMGAWCWYTRVRFESTHGWSSPVLLTKKSSRRVLTWSQRGSPKNPLDHTHFQFENRSRTTCHRFLQSFALTWYSCSVSALLRETLAGISNQMVRLVSPVLLLSSLLHHEHHNNTQHTTHRDSDTHTEAETERQRQRQNRSIENDFHVRHFQ